MTDFNKRRAEALDEVERVLDAMLLDTEAVWNESPGFVLCEALRRIRALRQNEPEGGGGDAEPEHGRMYLVLIPSIGHHGVDRSHWRIAWYRYGRWEKIEGGEFDPQPTVWRELPPTPDPAPEPEPLTWEDWGIGEKATISGPDGIATAAFKYSDDEAIAVGPHGKIWYWKFTESDAEFTIVSIDKGQEDG